MVAIFVALWRRQASLFIATMTIGALAWTCGNAQWLGGAPIYRVVFWWLAFLVLTIAGERLELNRVLRPTRCVARRVRRRRRDRAGRRPCRRVVAANQAFGSSAWGSRDDVVAGAFRRGAANRASVRPDAVHGSQPARRLCLARCRRRHRGGQRHGDARRGLRRAVPRRVRRVRVVDGVRARADHLSGRARRCRSPTGDRSICTSASCTCR